MMKFGGSRPLQTIDPRFLQLKLNAPRLAMFFQFYVESTRSKSYGRSAIFHLPISDSMKPLKLR